MIGDLTKVEAKAFVLCGDAVVDGAADLSDSVKKWPGLIKMNLAEEIPDGAEGLWDKIYKRCGGNIGLLQECVIEAGVKADWNKALRTITRGPRGAVMSGFSPTSVPELGEAPLWTKPQWKRTLQCITKANHHAILRSKLEGELDALKDDGIVANGKLILLSMVGYNLLVLRPDSDLARDLPLEVFDDEEEDDRGVPEEVVMLPSPAHVWAAQRLLPKKKNKNKTRLDSKAIYYMFQLNTLNNSQ